MYPTHYQKFSSKTALKILMLLWVFVLCVGNPVQAQFLTGYGQRPIIETPQIEKPLAPVILTAPQTKKEQEEAPVDLQADKLTHNEETQVITASGNVFLSQSGRILRADEVSYDLQSDKVTATGHVVLNEVNGDIHYADYLELTNNMKDGFVQGLKSKLQDGSRFTADDGTRQNGTKIRMNDASYTPCEPCEEDPDRSPVWQIVAAEVSHDQEDRRISYRHARFELFGVPIAYTPYFAHPDGSIKRKSGFLAPSAGYKSELGVFVENQYYIDIAPNKDATAGLLLMTEEAPLLTGGYRHRFDTASLKLNGGITRSERTDSVAGQDIVQDAEVRGHIFADGLWDINNKWRAGLDAAWTSDDQYMRQYDFTNDDVLENELYVERFSGRDYAVGRLLAFQDIRVSEKQDDQPEVLPEIYASFIGEPGAVPLVKGRWNLEASLLGLRRDGAGQDMNRVSLKAGWQRRMVSDYGLVANIDGSLREDIYNTRDRAVATSGSGRSREASASRFSPNLHIETSYPLARNLENAQARIEPVAALTFAKNIDVDEDIPNEDSQDVQIDASNLFETDRFPGLDRIEDKSRVTYGLRSGLYGYGGSQLEVFLGQSHRFDDDDTPFPEGSGLEDQDSDIVGQVSAIYKDAYNLDYRFQLNSHDVSSRRHEIDASARWDKFALSSRYLFAKALEGTDIDESREQLRADASYYLTEKWRLNAAATQDFGDSPGLRKATTGLDYFGQCVSWSLIGVRNFTEDSSGDSDTEIIFRIGLKNLGEFAASGLNLGGSSE